MEFVWFSLALAGELLGPPPKFLVPICVATSGEKNPPMGSIPKASRWPVSLIVRPVFLNFRNLFVSHCLNSVDSEFKTTKGNKELQNTDATGVPEKTHRPATPMSVRKLCSRDFGGAIINGEGLLKQLLK